MAQTKEKKSQKDFDGYSKRARNRTPGFTRIQIRPAYVRVFASATCAMRNTASQRANTGDAPRLEISTAFG